MQSYNEKLADRCLELARQLSYHDAQPIPDIKFTLYEAASCLKRLNNNPKKKNHFKWFKNLFK